MNMLFLIIIIPFSSLYGLENQATTSFFLVIGGFTITLLSTRQKKVSIKSLKGSKYALWIAIGGASLLTYGAIAVFNGFPSLTALNFANVYEVRESVNYGPLFFPYFVNWQSTVFNPFLIGYGLLKSNKKLILVGIVLQFLLFLYTGHKSYFFGPIVVIGVAILVKKKNLLLGILIGLNSVIAFALIIYKVFGEHLLATLFIRRAIFISVKNFYYYFDFFSRNEKVYFSHSILKYFIDYPYQIPTSNLIGAVYYNSPNAWVNVGYLADAYMNAGVLGVIIISILLGVVLSFFDSLTTKVNIELIIITAFMPFFKLLSGALLTSLLTGGIIISFLVLQIFPEEKKRV
ncbi:hypothetical protein [Pseudobacillus wudalianchiensis]|nr:hypothetical protein [Bacillus wudalianchiensis]